MPLLQTTTVWCLTPGASSMTRYHKMLRHMQFYRDVWLGDAVLACSKRPRCNACFYQLHISLKAALPVMTATKQNGHCYRASKALLTVPLMQDVVTRGGKFVVLYKRPGKRIILNNEGCLMVSPSSMEASIQQSIGGTHKFPPVHYDTNNHSNNNNNNK